MNKRYFSKALFYNERKNIIISMVAHFFIFAIILKAFTYSLEDSQKFGSTIASNSISLIPDITYFFILIISLTTVFHSYENKEDKQSFMLTQPYSRDSILITRTVAYMVSYIIPIILYGIISSILIVTNKLIFEDTVLHIISLLNLKLFALFAMLTVIVMLVQLIQMLFGKNLMAFTLSMFILMMLLIDIMFISTGLSENIPYLKDFYITDILYHVTPMLLNYFYNSFFMVSLSLIFISFLILYICILLNRRSLLENLSSLFIFKSIENIFKILLSIFIAIILTIFLAVIAIYFKISFSSVNHIVLIPLLDIVWIALIILTYKILGKIASKRRLV